MAKVFVALVALLVAISQTQSADLSYCFTSDSVRPQLEMFSTKTSYKSVAGSSVNPNVSSKYFVPPPSSPASMSKTFTKHLTLQIVRQQNSGYFNDMEQETLTPTRSANFRTFQKSKRRPSKTMAMERDICVAVMLN